MAPAMARSGGPVPVLACVEEFLEFGIGTFPPTSLHRNPERNAERHTPHSFARDLAGPHVSPCAVATPSLHCAGSPRTGTSCRPPHLARLPRAPRESWK